MPRAYSQDLRDRVIDAVLRGGESRCSASRRFGVSEASAIKWLQRYERAGDRVAVCQAIRAAGARLLFLPPYSPDLNPIEQVFAKLKALLRKAAERSVEATWRRIGSLLDAFSAQECANYLRNSGYASI